MLPSLQTTSGFVSFGKPARFVDIDVGAITEGVRSAGAVLVFMQTVNVAGVDTTIYVPLPHRAVFTVSSSAFHYTAEITQGRIRLLFFIENLSDPTASGAPLAITQPTRSFRWVIIPPTAGLRVADLPVADGADRVLEALRAHGFGVRQAP